MNFHYRTDFQLYEYPLLGSIILAQKVKWRAPLHEHLENRREGQTVTAPPRRQQLNWRQLNWSQSLLTVTLMNPSIRSGRSGDVWISLWPWPLGKVLKWIGQACPGRWRCPWWNNWKVREKVRRTDWTGTGFRKMWKTTSFWVLQLSPYFLPEWERHRLIIHGMQDENRS